MFTRTVHSNLIDTCSKADLTAATIAAPWGLDAHDAAFTAAAAVRHAVVQLSERLAGVGAEGIDEVLSLGLRTLAEALHMDWAILWRLDSDGGSAIPSHHWVRHPLPIDPLQLGSTPLVAPVLEGRAQRWFTRADAIDDADACRAIRQQGLRSGVVLPVAVAAPRGSRAALGLGSAMVEQPWTSATLDQLRIASALAGQALTRRDDRAALNRVRAELRQLRERASIEEPPEGSHVRVLDTPGLRHRPRAENEYLRHEVLRRLGSERIVGQSDAIRRVLEQAQQVASTDSTVLLLGETGTGKELLATRIHELSARRGRVMVRVNCSAIPGTLIESELFGREKGAFTGAVARQIGRFEAADHSTIFLDEIGDLPADVQVKLLRVLEERQIERLGNPRSLAVDVRIIAATHRELERRIAEEAFREDLFYRLNVFPIRVPALRERAEDIPLLVWRFVIEFSKSFGKRIDAIPRENMAELQRYHWPGNIRELRNVVERAMIVSAGPRLVIALPPAAVSAEPVHTRLEDVEREHIRSVLERVRWRIRGVGAAADQLGLRPTTLETRMAKLGLARPKTA